MYIIKALKKNKLVIEATKENEIPEGIIQIITIIV